MTGDMVRLVCVGLNGTAVRGRLVWPTVKQKYGTIGWFVGAVWPAFVFVHGSERFGEGGGDWSLVADIR